jgi:hypothetical protein
LTKAIKYDIINYKKVRKGKDMKTELDKVMQEMKDIVESMKWENFVDHAMQKDITNKDIDNHKKAWEKVTKGGK